MDGLSDVLSWLHSRILTLRILLLYALLITGLWICHSPAVTKAVTDTKSHHVSDIVTGSALLAGLLIAFRLWDDLADRRFDRTRPIESSNPRVLVTTQYARLFTVIVCVLLLALAAASCQRAGYSGLSLYLALCVFMTFVYSLQTLNSRSRLRREILVLLKYPLFLLLLSNAINVRTITVATVLYGILLICNFVEHKTLVQHRAPKATE